MRPLFLSFILSTSFTTNALIADDIEAAHREIWKRFISPHGTFYDYTTLDGQVELPTAEECAADKPNALGWWSPIENGAFFGGLYLDALCNRWKVDRDEFTAVEARKIAAGLIKLAEIGKTPGFVARGIAADGRGHYAASSSDQTYPWFYGMWRYATSGLPTSDERQHLIETMTRVALGLEANDWKMPCERKELGYFGRWAGGFEGTTGILSGAEPQFDAAARLLFVLRALHQLTGDARWLDQYRSRLMEKAPGSERTRLQVCTDGVQYVAPGEPPRYPESPSIWTSASSQAGLKALVEMEDDATLRAQFQHGLEANATSAARHISRFKNYDNDNTLTFNIHWRKVLEFWKPQADIGESVTLAKQQYRVWNKQSPRRIAEFESMRDPLFAAWIVTLSGNPELIEKSRADIHAALSHYRWAKLHTCLFFMAECVNFEMRRK